MGLAAASVGGPIMLIVADFTTLFEVKAVTTVLEDVPGGVVKGRRNHSWAMVIIGIVALPMAYGAVRGNSRPAMAALGALGLVAAIIALAFDLPDATGTSTLARTFEEAKATPQEGFYLETLGAALLLVAGVGGLLLSRPQGGDRSGRTAREARDEAARAEAAAARAAARRRRS
jgi:hypothetical protein